MEGKPPLACGNCDHRRIGDEWVIAQPVLDVLRPNVHAGWEDNQVLRPAGQPDIPLGIAGCEVAVEYQPSMMTSEVRSGSFQ